MHLASVAALGRTLASREISAVELAQLYLARIQKHPDLNAFLDVRPEVTLAQARAADDRIARGEAGPLTGVPVAHKDIFVTRYFCSTAGSRMLKGYMSPFDATVVERLGQAGMVTLGKLNCDEFAMGSSNENSYWQRIESWDKTAVPGGSSGLGRGMAASDPAATATDTGGSIRSRPPFRRHGHQATYGRASRWGMIAFASSLDHAES
jgi:aspartyl-tRNA(Asn)/glutamyl-tRNA(Gln) amidotransferase subunit A